MNICKDQVLRLYIAGISIDNQDAILTLKEILKEKLGNTYQFEVIDILFNPDLADNDNIVATPTLVRQYPEPARKVILDLGSEDKMLVGINILFNDL
ncbi:MAG: circadian clock KaiB family protein [Legionellaceae bacterium]|nr:circadian clock KaiB family protein [Legionellaceae bacterium]